MPERHIRKSFQEQGNEFQRSHVAQDWEQRQKGGVEAMRVRAHNLGRADCSRLQAMWADPLLERERRARSYEGG